MSGMEKKDNKDETRQPSSVGNFLGLDIEASILDDVLCNMGNSGNFFKKLIEENNTPQISNSLDLKIPHSEENKEPEKASPSGDSLDNTKNIGKHFFLEQQEANNISKAAYKEIMTKAFEARTWVVATPALGSLEEILQMFHSLLPLMPGMRVEFSIESAVVPVYPDFLISIMMDANRWASYFSHIVSCGSGHVPTGVLPKLIDTDEAIKRMLMVNAKFQLPTPLVQTRKFCFLRCLREIIPNIWAIVDISSNYFPDTSGFGSERMCQRRPSEQMCGRRPSGLIFRWHEKGSQVIWIENVEIQEGQSQYGIYSGMINSNLAFSAKRWVNTLIWRLKRTESRFLNIKLQVNREELLNLTEVMRMVYLDIVSDSPDEGKWITLSKQDVRILRSVTVDHVSGLNNYIAVTSIRLQVKPISVFDFLVKKNMDIQWPRLLNPEEPEEVIRFATEDVSNCITLHERPVFHKESKEGLEYLLQMASKDGFCSFIISMPMNPLDFHTTLFFRSSADASLQPSGFAIMPDGPDGLHSDASLVTIAMQQQLDVSETDQAFEIMSNLISAIIKETLEEVSRGSNTSS